MTTLFILFLLAALVLGPKRAVELSRRAGTYWARFQAMKTDLTGQLNAEIDAASADPPVKARTTELTADALQQEKRPA